MVKIKNLKIIILSIFLLVMLSLNVNAFGISSPYWDDNPLYVQPGETKEFSMSLQNMAGGEDIIMTAELNSGKEIATLTGQSTTYNVPLGSSNVPVYLKIIIPKDAKPKQEWQVGISFKTASKNTGPVTIGGAVDKGFKVIISEPKTTSESVNTKANKQIISSKLTGFLALVIVLIIILVLVSYFRKKRVKKE